MSRFAALLLVPLMLSAQAPAGSVIENTALYQDASGTTLASPTVRLTVAAVCSASLSTTPAQNARAGETRLYPVVLTNTGNANQTFPLQLDTGTLQGQVFLDADANNQLDPADPQVTQVTLGPDQGAHLLVRLKAAGAGTVSATLRTGCEGQPLSSVLTLDSRSAPLSIEKVVLGDTTVSTGETLDYRVTVRNDTLIDSGPARVQDLLPSGLSYLSADGTPAVSTDPDGRTRLDWSLSNLAPGEQVQYLLHTRVLPMQDDALIENVAEASSVAGRVTSTPPAVVRAFDSRLVIVKSADPRVGEPGGVVTYTLTVSNPSPAKVSDVVLRDTPDTGLSYLPGSSTVSGRKSADPASDGASLVFNLGTLVGGQSVTVTYRLRLPLESGTLDNTAFATGQGSMGPVIAQVKSNNGVAAVVVRRQQLGGQALLVGRVYADDNGNLKYDPGIDRPVKGARVMLAGGREAFTDRNGNYSFNTLTPGRYAVYLDPRSVTLTPSRVPQDRGVTGSRELDVTNLTTADFPLTTRGGSVGPLEKR